MNGKRCNLFFKRFVSAFLAVLMLFAYAPVSLAENAEDTELKDADLQPGEEKSEFYALAAEDLKADEDNSSDEEANDYRDENGYITSTYGYTLKGDPYVEDREIYSFYGSAVYDLNGGTNGSVEKIMENRETSFYNMSDKFFFGEWDSEKGEWITESKINYEAYPGLSKTEEYVKLGDYENAKNEYYLYYLEKEQNGNRAKSKVTSDAGRICAYLATKNFMYNPISGFTPLSLLEFEQEPKWHSVDVSGTVSNYKGKREAITFWVVATDKDGGMAEIASRETGETAPKLTVIVNGMKKEYTAVADTYISAGGNNGKYFGYDKSLKVSESDTADEYKLVDSNTNRAYIKFDISDIKAGDSVSAANLELYGSNTVDNGKNKEAVVFYSDDSAWDETLIYYKVPSLIFSYDQLDSWLWVGPGTRQVDWGSRYTEDLLRFSGWYGNLIGMYNTTGDEKYAYTVLRILMDFLHVTGMHTRYMKDLDIGVRCSTAPGAFMQLLESEYMTPDIFTAFMKYMWIEGNEFMQFFTSDMNWGVMEREGHYTIAIEYPEFKDSEKWIEDIRRRYREVVEAVIQDDGSCWELALGYVWTTVSSPISSYSLADSIGIEDAPAPLDDETIKAMDKLVEFMMYSSMPGYRDHQEGDTNSYSGSMTEKFMDMYKLSGNKKLLYGATKGKEGEKPDFTSYAWLGSGKKAVMRTDWSNDAVYLYASVDGNQGNHGHADDCNIMAYAYGQYLLIDPLYGSYSGTNASSWLKSSEAHNVVTVNGRDHASSADVDIALWETNNGFDFIKMKTANANGADNYERSVLFVKPGFWIVNDYLEPTDKENANSYSQTWHFLPEAKPEIDDETKVVSTNFNKANIQVVPVNIDKLSDANLKDGFASGGMGSIAPAQYASYEKRHSGNAVFNTVLYPEKIGENHNIKTETVKISGLSETQASAYDLYVTNLNNGKTTHYQYYQLHDESKKEIRTVGSFVTDASLLFAEYDSNGNVVSVIAQNASYVRNNETDTTVWQSDTAVKNISVKYVGNLCHIDSSDLSEDFLTDRNAVIAKTNSGICEVYVNGENVQFDTTSNYIFFGIEPDDENEEEADGNESSNKPGSSSSSSGGGSKVHGSSSRPSAPQVIPSIPDNPITGNTMPSRMAAELENHWAENEIKALYEKGIVSGKSETEIGISDNITRAEFVTLLVRTLDMELVDYNKCFPDVSDDDWFAPYIQTAFDNNLFHGSDGLALPNEPVTREQMAKLICTFGEKLGITFKAGDVDSYQDKNDISDWAKEYVGYVIGGKIMTGRTDSTFNPKENTQRAEAFVVIYRMLNMIPS